jgi:2-phosphosulfolactate phosphatase
LSGQEEARCHLAWGRRGALEAAQRGDILVVVDTLSFSTAVITAVQQGGIIYPCSLDTDAAALARRVGDEVAVNRRDVPLKGRFSLSPVTYGFLEPGTRVVLASPNGATCSQYARQVPYLFVGALVNAQAVGSAVSRVMGASDLPVTVLACGERWRTPSEDGELRFALEDYLGAGAILSYLPYNKSPDARVCVGAFLQAQDELGELLRECESGRELSEMSFAEDVQWAARLNASDTVPFIQGEYLTRFDPDILGK